jgi:hypothetical protein
MNNLQENRLSMYLAVRDYLLQYPEVTKDLPNYNQNFTGLQKTIREIQSIAEVQKSDTKGYARQKQNLKDKLITLTMDTSSKMNAFAKFNGNLMLQSEVKLTRSQLNRATDTGLRDFAQIIYAKAEENLEPLKEYGVTPETQAEFLDIINEYNASLPGPRVAKAGTVQATKQLAILFEKADQLLENIETAIGIIKMAQVNFYNGFSTAKKIVNSGTGSLALKGSAVDIRSGIAIKGAKFVFKPVPDSMTGIMNSDEIIKITADKGKFIIKSIPYGTYSVTVSKPGYKEKIVSVVVAEGEMTELRVEMEAA